MRDFWIAECVPCKWETRHDTEELAIADAEAHVDALHRKIHPLVRAQKYMGHVTQRTVMEPGDEPEPIAAPAPPQPAPGGIALVPAAADPANPDAQRLQAEVTALNAAADATPAPEKTGV